MLLGAADIFLLEVPLGGKLYNPRLLWHRKQSVFVRLQDGSGRYGWGECWTFDSSADALIRYLQTEVLPSLVGRVIDSPAAIWDSLWQQTSLTGRHGMMASALSALDVALHDLEAQAKGQPLGACLGVPASRDVVPVYASAGLYRVEDSLERLAGEMSGLIAAGHRSVKMKFGALSFEQDLERMRTVREAIGPTTNLIVDAVYSLDRDKARRWLPIWQELDVEAVQAPFAATDWPSMIWLNRDCGMPIVAFESESRPEIFHALLEQGGIGMMQFSPVAVGGITAARRLIAMAQEYEVPVTLQCSSTWLAQAVALELARSHPQIRHVELHTLHRGLFNTVPEAENTPCDGHLRLHDRPGLGFAPPLAQLELMTHDLPDFRQADPHAANRQKSVGIGI